MGKWFYMNYKEGINYTILANNVDKKFLEKFKEFSIVEDLSYKKLKELIETFNRKQIVLNEAFYGLKIEEKLSLVKLMDMRNISFINITSKVEDAVLSDYIFVYDNEDLVLEGNMESVLKEEKILKRLGFGLPFTVDLSIQLGFYDVLDKVYYNVQDLVEALWN